MGDGRTVIFRIEKNQSKHDPRFRADLVFKSAFSEIVVPVDTFRLEHHVFGVDNSGSKMLDLFAKETRIMIADQFGEAPHTETLVIPHSPLVVGTALQQAERTFLRLRPRLRRAGYKPAKRVP